MTDWSEFHRAIALHGPARPEESAKARCRYESDATQERRKVAAHGAELVKAPKPGGEVHGTFS
jgi:hypothetical protein